MSEETVAQKITSLQRCVSQARVALSTAGSDFKTNYLLQDAAVLNINRACETALDLANMLIRKRRLGIPSESRESFGILMRELVLEQGLGDRLQKMVGVSQPRCTSVSRFRHGYRPVCDSKESRRLAGLCENRAAPFELSVDSRRRSRARRFLPRAPRPPTPLISSQDQHRRVSGARGTATSLCRMAASRCVWHVIDGRWAGRRWPRTVDFRIPQKPEIFPTGRRLDRILQSVDFRRQQRTDVSNRKDSLQPLQRFDRPA